MIKLVDVDDDDDDDDSDDVDVDPDVAVDDSNIGCYHDFASDILQERWNVKPPTRIHKQSKRFWIKAAAKWPTSALLAKPVQHFLEF